MKMTISQKIKMALAYKGMSEADLARAVGSSPQAFNQRMKTGKFSSEEMEKIADALEAEYFFGFAFKDGTKIWKEKNRDSLAHFCAKAVPSMYRGRVFRANQKSIPHTRRRVASSPTKSHFVLPCPLRSFEKLLERQ